jgi:4-amino-4-deoxy-L-arabinose transferase-like glycosyltransferase
VLSLRNRLHLAAARFAALPWPVLFALFFAAVALSHLTLLRLPYYWDEGGYYIPAALDFYHHGWLVPHFTNAHPPLPNIVLGTLWHIVGFHILATRLLVCAFAAAALLAVFRLTQRLLDPAAAIAVTLLTAVYPIWFAQSTLAHADIFAAAFTLWAFALYLPANTLYLPANLLQPNSGHLDRSAGSPARDLPRWGASFAALSQDGVESPAIPRHYLAIAALFSLAALSKETSIVDPAALAALQLAFLIRDRRNRTPRHEHLRPFHLLAALSFPLLPLLAWYAYHHHVTGFTFGNPEFLRYNATANLTLAHISQALRYRFLHLFWQRNIWLPILFAFACLLLPRRTDSTPLNWVPPLRRGSIAPKVGVPPAKLSPATLLTITVLIAANWLFFSVLGGALLTRYLLPIYPLILLVCVAVWRAHTQRWPLLAAVTFAAFLSALWINPPTSFAPEDNLTYRDMIVVHQQAIDFVAQHYPDATVLTAWPVAADLFRPELGYVTRPIKAFSIDDFTLPNVRKAAEQPGRYDTAIVFTTHFLAPAFRHYLLTHPNSARGREFTATRDLSPAVIAAILGGHIVFQTDHNGEWAAVLRFNRSYDARMRQPLPLQSFSLLSFP